MMHLFLGREHLNVSSKTSDLQYMTILIIIIICKIPHSWRHEPCDLLIKCWPVMIYHILTFNWLSLFVLMLFDRHLLTFHLGDLPAADRLKCSLNRLYFYNKVGEKREMTTTMLNVHRMNKGWATPVGIRIREAELSVCETSHTSRRGHGRDTQRHSLWCDPPYSRCDCLLQHIIPQSRDILNQSSLCKEKPHNRETSSSSFF